MVGRAVPQVVSGAADAGFANTPLGYAAESITSYAIDLCGTCVKNRFKLAQSSPLLAVAARLVNGGARFGWAAGAMGASLGLPIVVIALAE
jgi:hypothetical protein